MHLALDMLPGAAGRLGLTTAEKAQRLHFLVAEHQTMSQIAQRRELSDPRVVADFAGRVGDIENLRMLYLLTYADISAVGPDVWSDWKGARELADRTREVLERRRVAVPERAKQLSEARDAIRTLARGVHPEDAVESSSPDGAGHLSSLMMPPERALEHMELRRRLPEEKLIITHRHMPEMGVTDLTVCMYDAFGIFSKTCGTLAAHNMNIVGARIVTMADGVVLIPLQVTDPWAGSSGTRRSGKESSAPAEILTGVRRVEALWSKSSIRLRKKDSRSAASDEDRRGQRPFGPPHGRRGVRPRPDRDSLPDHQGLVRARSIGGQRQDIHGADPGDRRTLRDGHAPAQDHERRPDQEDRETFAGGRRRAGTEGMRRPVNG